MPRTIAEIAASLGASLTALHELIPETIRELVLIAVLFIGLDTLSGFWLAAKRAVIVSRTLKDQLIAKCLQYGILVCLGVGACVLSHTWAPLGAALGAIVGIETISILENLSLLETAGGVNLGPAGPFLRRIRRYLVDSEPQTKPRNTCETEEIDRILPTGDEKR